jgi:hypothetical protein
LVKKLIYYVCFAGVRTSFGTKLWQFFVKTSDKNQWVDVECPPSKKETIRSILIVTVPDKIDDLTIKGVGHGAKTFVKWCLIMIWIVLITRICVVEKA